jgi:transposase
MSFCEGCFDKQRQIDRLREEVDRLKQKLRYEERKTKEGYFGSATPSAKAAVKENSALKEQNKKGGAWVGHKGYGRGSINEEDADHIEYLAVGDICPDCGKNLVGKGTVDRSVIDSVPVKAKKILYKCEKKWCAHCRKTIIEKPPVLPKSLYGNQLIAQAASMHYGHGVPIGRVEAILGDNLPSGSLFDVFHRLANLWKPAMPKIIEEYRSQSVKHADETGWRTDGHSGFAWLFCSDKLSLFQFKDTRSAKVPQSIFGRAELPGVLVVDRYRGYNKVRIKLQYCYAHLLRKVEDLGKQFIDEAEVQCFVGTFAPLLSEAMHLRTTSISDKIYYKKALLIRKKILKVADSPAKHLGIKEMQLIFKENKDRLYHWVEDRSVPAENNRAERELRPTVIARKVSFGSQSEKGAQTRSILMTILHTAQKRLRDQTLADWLKGGLDKLASNPELDPYALLPP